MKKYFLATITTRTGESVTICAFGACVCDAFQELDERYPKQCSDAQQLIMVQVSEQTALKFALKFAPQG
jgi:hypothetical protein